MSFRPDTNGEPIPGYKLIERLGGGGFGDVWKCEAPGGMHKAIKFVFGNLEDVSTLDDSVKAEQELRSLERIKRIRHPFILTLERYEIIDGQLIIVTELADCSLYDHFRTYRDKGMIGIPRDELLGFMSETAEALDVMTREHDLLHLDIKPQNLFLIYNHIKIGDFGLVKDLEGMQANVTGGVTPVYAAPETFEGYISRFSDQYSLAIVYQELLTGVRPFAGSSTKQLMLQHIQGQPNLDPLPISDRAVIERALSKKPTDRWETCSAMVAALKQAGRSPATSDVPTEPNALVETQQAKTPKPEAKPYTIPASSKTVPGRMQATDYFEIGAEPSKTASIRGNGTVTQSRTVAKRTKPIVGIDQEAGVLQPTVILGLGQFGRATLQWIGSEIQKRYGSQGIPIIRCLAVDTDPQAPTDDLIPTPRAEELVLARLNRPARYIRSRDSLPPVEDWLDTNILYRMPRTQTTNGIRALGRLAFIEHHGTLSARIEREIREATDGDAISAAFKQTNLPMRSVQPRIYVVAHLSGGTASGMFLDCAYTVRQILHKMEVDEPEVEGVFFVPDGSCMRTPDLPEANAVAALYELFHYQEARETYRAQYDSKAGPVEDAGKPFIHCTFFEIGKKQKGPVPQEHGQPRMVLEQASACLVKRMLTAIGRVTDQYLAGHAQASHLACGLRILSSPRRPIIRRSAKTMLNQVVNYWQHPATPEMQGTVRERIDGFLKYAAIVPETLYQQLEKAVVAALGQPAETLVGGTLAPFNHTIQEKLPDTAEVKSALRSIMQLVGTGKGDDSLTAGPEYTDSPLLAALYSVAEQVLRTNATHLVFAVFRHLDKPVLRLGAAEAALQHAITTLDGWIAHHDSKAQKAHIEFGQALTYLRNDLTEYERLRGTAKRKWPSMPTPAERLLAVFRARYRYLLHERLGHIYSRFREICRSQEPNLEICRTRLNDLRILTKASGEHRTASADLSQGRETETMLVPPGYKNLLHAVHSFAQSITPEDMDKFDVRLGEKLSKRFPHIGEMLLAGGEPLVEFGEQIIQEMGAFLDERLELDDVAGLILKQQSTGLNTLKSLFADAKPHLEPGLSPKIQEAIFMTLPNSMNGRKIGGMAEQVINNVNMILVPKCDEIVLFRLMMGIDLENLSVLGEKGVQAYRSATAIEHFTPHSRQDVELWHIPVLAS